MNILILETKFLMNMIITLVITAISVLALSADMAQAKRGGSDENRFEFYGIVQERPQDGQQGVWVIGGRTFIADQQTEFDENEGNLSLDGCAKVHVRNGRVHEIDSEPMHDCQ